MNRSICLWTVAAFVVALGAGIHGSRGEDWAQWRGPNRDGICSEKGLVSSWSDANPPPVVFEAKGLGSGYSSVTVSKGRVYTMGGRGGRANIICLDEKTGEILWTTPIGGGGETNCTPTVDGDLVYGLSTQGDLACLKTDDGSIVWTRNFKSDFGGSMMSGWGYSESPLVDGDRLVCSPGAADAAIVALDKKTGDVIWKSKVANVGGAGYSSVVVANAGRVKVYLQLMGKGLVGVAADDGRFLFGYERVANGTANIPTPIVKDNYVFCSSGYGTGAALLKLTAKGKNVTAQEVYYLPGDKFQNHHGGMIRIGNYIYAGHGHNEGFPVCLDMMSGQTKWGPGRGPGSGSAAIVAADGKLVFRYQNGVVALIDASPQKFNLRGTFQIPHDPGNSWPHPVIANGKLFLRVQDRLLCYDVKA